MNGAHEWVQRPVWGIGSLTSYYLGSRDPLYRLPFPVYVKLKFFNLLRPLFLSPKVSWISCVAESDFLEQEIHRNPKET